MEYKVKKVLIGIKFTMIFQWYNNVQVNIVPIIVLINELDKEPAFVDSLLKPNYAIIQVVFDINSQSFECEAGQETD